MRVLNDVPKEPVVPPPPEVKFNFVDVTFPKSSHKKHSESAEIYGSTSRNPNKKSNAGKGRNPRDQTRDDKENSDTGRAQRNMERDRREYLSRLLRTGMPVWEEVPVEEMATKVIGKHMPTLFWKLLISFAFIGNKSCRYLWLIIICITGLNSFMSPNTKQ